MKELKLLILMVLIGGFTPACQSQNELALELAHGEYICSGHEFEDSQFFTTFNSTNNQISIYDTQFKLIRQLIYEPTIKFNTVQISYLSKEFFDTDDKFEFVIQAVQATGKSNYKIINEDNKVLFDNGEDYFYIKPIGQQNYIVTSKSEFNYSVTPPILTKTDKLYKINGKYRPIRW